MSLRRSFTYLQVNGFAAGFAATGDKDRQAAVSNFFDIITGSHSYATGGNNDGEYWGPAYQLASTIAGVSRPALTNLTQDGPLCHHFYSQGHESWQVTADS